MFDENSDLNNVLRVYAPAKINLHLEILGIRNDGYHELAMVMQSIELTDELYFKERKDNLINLETDDKNLRTNEENLIIKAANLLKGRTKELVAGVDIYLRKRIPIGAGLAGGSSDGMGALVGLNKFWQLGFSEKELESFASELGSDMPFCLKGGTQLCFGRGGDLEAFAGDLSSMAVLLVKDPLVSISTPWAYKRYREMHGKNYMNSEYEFDERRKCLRDSNWLQSLSSNPPEIRNDLQKIIESEVKAVKRSLDLLYSFPGSIAVAMSGSGPSCFALYSDLNEARAVFEHNQMRNQEAGLKCWCSPLRSRGVSFDQ